MRDNTRNPGAGYRKSYSGDFPGETLIGETPKTRRGYYVRVTTIQFEANSGMRVRLRLLKEDVGLHLLNRSALLVSHFDITTEVARDLWPLIQKASALGVSRR